MTRRYFYPRSPCGERPADSPLKTPPPYFYPRSPCGERHRRIWCLPRWADFYPRSPCGERRHVAGGGKDDGTISIHALLAESDQLGLLRRAAQIQFLSTLSLRRATYGWSWYDDFTEFLSTLSLRRATHKANPLQNQHQKFLSTLSLRRATTGVSTYRKTISHFYPRSPCGERPIIQKITILTIAISIHALLAESDWDWFFTGTLDSKFLSTLSLRRAT